MYEHTNLDVNSFIIQAAKLLHREPEEVYQALVELGAISPTNTDS